MGMLVAHHVDKNQKFYFQSALLIGSTLGYGSMELLKDFFWGF